MPYPERAFRAVQNSWHPSEWQLRHVTGEAGRLRELLPHRSSPNEKSQPIELERGENDA